MSSLAMAVSRARLARFPIKPKPKPVAHIAPQELPMSISGQCSFTFQKVPRLKAPNVSIFARPPLPIAVRYSIKEIRGAVCRHYPVSVTDIISERRFGSLVEARHIAIALCRALTTRSLPEIARWFGDRDHTTILHAAEKMRPVLEDISGAIEHAPLDYLVRIAIAATARIKPKDCSHIRRKSHNKNIFQETL